MKRHRFKRLSRPPVLPAPLDLSSPKTRVSASSAVSRRPVASTACEVALEASMSTTATGTDQFRNTLGGLYGACSAQATMR